MPEAIPDALPEVMTELDVIDAGDAVVARYHLGEDGEYILGRDRETAHVLLDDKSVSRRHALLRRTGATLGIADAGSLNGTVVGSGRRRRSTASSGEGSLDWLDWPVGEPVTIGVFTLTWRLLSVARDASGNDAIEAEPDLATTTLGADRDGPSDALPAVPVQDQEPPAFPATLFGEADVVPLAGLRIAAAAHGVLIEERDYLSIGGGLGSLAWVDHLRIFGVARTAIRVIGVHSEPHGKWAAYCRNSQIPGDERIRSNSASTPDNIWGFPGFSLREAWSGVRRGRIAALVPVLRVFGEPLFAETYTPRLAQVIAAIAHECRRIGWDGMFADGRAIALRKTDDGRYALAYRVPRDLAKADAANADFNIRDRLCIARHVHVATGYPATRILPILQAFRRKHPDSTEVVNAYEPHDALYAQLEAAGGTVVVEGRGIVASRILQRLSEARGKNRAITVIHVMRYPVTRGHGYDRARRGVADNVEVQPFNWPKASWGGTLRRRLETADPTERARLMEIWGGTTTADRRDWRAILAAGKGEGWYRAVFGELLRIRRVDGTLALTLRPPGSTAQTITLAADFLIDCTGLVADVMASPFLRDLLDVYAPPRNRAAGTGPERGMSGIRVSNQFEVRGLRNGTGTVHAAGVIAANGPYAAVDSFLGLSYAALRSVDHLASLGAPGLRRMGRLRSFGQWLKWCRGVAP